MWMSSAELAWREPCGVAETPPEYVFHRPRLYLDTTIPSYLTARVSRDLDIARYQKITTRWWNSWRTNFDIRISELVWKESSRGNPDAAERRLQLLARFSWLEVNARADALCKRLLRDCRLPARASMDAAHVAVAAVHDIEFLLTWNFAHLVNPNFEPRIRSVCELEGLSCPLLCTPEQLMARYEHAHTR
jgi:predicted nucleic acid-binding protein